MSERQKDKRQLELALRVKKEAKNTLKLFLLFYVTYMLFYWLGSGFFSLNLCPLDTWILEHYPLWFILVLPFFLGYILALIPAFVGSHFYITKLLTPAVLKNKNYLYRTLWYFIVAFFYLFPFLLLVTSFVFLASFNIVPVDFDFVSLLVMFVARKSGYTGSFCKSIIPSIFTVSFGWSEILSATTTLYLNYRSLKKRGKLFF